MLDDFLVSLGNSGTPEILPLLQQHLDSSDPAIRSAALDALRRLETPEAVALLQQYASQDPSPGVRLGAIESLTNHQGGHVLAIFQTAMTDPSIDVRSAVGQALDQHPEPQAQQMLQQMSQNDPATSVRQLAAQLLSSN